ncbi:hypothetical protein [Chelonobacter oris]|uniref:hypothetical protein n=1 Tax=Chelonobacter oris TaxID=505317 RepID=UPI0024478F4E|nr:hypothetical protein [Chelonobacter oris]
MGLVLASSVNAVYKQGSLAYDKVFYQIGGGSAVMVPPARKRPHEISLGIGWQANLMCGNFDFKTTIKNQLNGITEGFRDLMDNVIQSATGAVASLPAMMIQRANPQLYDILTNGLYQGNPTTADLMVISASNMLITRGLLEALKEDPEVRLLASRLSGEIAISRTLEKALLLRRIMLSGMREPNVANNKEALAELERQLLMLDREIDQIQMEMDLQRKLTGNTALATLEKRALDRQKSLQNNSPDDTDKRINSLTGNIKDVQSDNSNSGNFDITEAYITLPIPTSSGGLNGVGGFWGSTGGYGANTGSYASRDLRAYESSNAYADGRATVYKTADGTLIRREGGSLAWRNNNPGNIRAGEFAKSMGAIGVGPSGFAIFPDAAAGERAIYALLKRKDYQNKTIAGAIERYAPPSENNTELYISMVTRASGLDRNTAMSALSDEHKTHIVNAIKRHEGWIVGSTK